MNPNSETLDITPMAPSGASFAVSNSTEADAARARIAGLNDPHQGTLEAGQAVSLRQPQTIEVGQGLPNVAAPFSPAAEAAGVSTGAPKPLPKVKLPRRPSSGKTPSALKPLLSAIGAFVLLLVIFKSQVLFSQLNYLRNKPSAAPAITATTTEAVSAAPTISIPKINVSAPVVYEPSVQEAAVLKALENGVVHYGTSVMPGQNGNMVIVGHSSNDWWEPGNYKFAFVLLDKLVVGDEFSVNYQGHKYVYKVTNVKVVVPTDLSVLANTSGPTATLITCTPPGTSWKRLVIQADQISPAPNTDTSPSTDNSGANTAPVQLPGNAPGFTSQLTRAWQNVTSGLAGLFGHKQSANQPTSTDTGSSDAASSTQSGTLPGAN